MKNTLHWKVTAMAIGYRSPLSGLLTLRLSAFIIISLLISQMCMAQTCTADAGSLSDGSFSTCLSDGSLVSLRAVPDGNVMVPAGFSTLFVLTSGETLVIEAVSAVPEFSVSEPGLYTIHTLVYDENTLDLGMVNFGVTTGGDVLSIVAANALCAALDVVGAPIQVYECGCPGVNCYARINVSLSADCTAEVTIGMGSPSIPLEEMPNYALTLSIHGEPIPTNILTAEYKDEEIEFTITNLNPDCGNSCWGNLIVEDKLKPVIDCRSTPIEIDCGELISYEGPGVTQSCGNETVTVINEEVEQLTCDPDFIKRITVTYGAKDDSGNMADSCTQEILIKRIPSYEEDSTAYTRAINYTVRNGNAFTCNTVAPVSVTGEPLFRGLTFRQLLENYCGIYAEMTKTNVITSDCKQVILRKWGLYDLTCRGTDTLYQQIQLIEFYDEVAPVIKYENPDYTESTSGRGCQANVFIPPVQFEDNCTEVRVDLVYPYGFIADFNAKEGEYVSLPVGVDTIIYRAIDACGNIGTDTLVITVQDMTPPVAVCEDKLAVSLTTDGISVIPVEVIDEGSHDDCKLASLQIKKMERDRCGFGQDIRFSDKVTFCCADLSYADALVPVILRVTDEAGQFNDCMVRVEIQDPGVISVVPLPHVTVSCGYPLHPEDLSDFGSMVPHDSMRESIALDDSLFVVDGPALDGYYTGTCSAVLTDEVYSDDRNQCGIGTVVRQITIQTEARTEYIKQSITFRDHEPFYINSQDPEDRNDDIIWPQDVVGLAIEGSCDASAYELDNLPEEQREPIILSGACELIAVSVTDEQFFSFEFGSDACFKILREWTVIDWCSTTDSHGPETWTYVQTIKVVNEVAPDVQCSDIVVTSTDLDCGPVDVNIAVTATDDCSQGVDLRFEYKVDFNKDGETDYSASGNDVIESFPIGEHLVYWTAKDKCGNTSEACEQMVSVLNTKAPQAYCVLGVVTDLVLMDTDGNGSLDTPMSIATPHHIHGNKKDSLDCVGELLKFSFSSDTTDVIREFNCNTLGDQLVRLYVTDSFGNQSFCETTIEIQDNFGNCDECREPTAMCHQNLEFVIGDNGRTIVNPTDLYAGNQTTDCSGRPLIFSFTESGNPSNADYSCRSIGVNDLTLFVIDADGISTSCTASITVTDPNNVCDSGCIEPLAVCSQNLLLNINPNGVTSINVSEVYAGDVTEDCAGNPLLLSFISNVAEETASFGCEDVGTDMVTLYVLRSDGVESSCSASINISDTNNVCSNNCGDPVISCNQNISLNLNDSGSAFLAVNQIYAGDDFVDCEGRPLSFSFRSDMVQTSERFSCDDVGTESIPIFVSDADGNTSTCSASITVTDTSGRCEDCVDPIAECQQNVSLDIMANATALLNIASVYAGSSTVDCSGRPLIFSFSSDAVRRNMVFDCTMTGTNTVALYVTDADGNQTSCMSSVTITDRNRICRDMCEDPVAICNQNISLNLDNQGGAILPVAIVFAGSEMMDCEGRFLTFSFSSTTIMTRLFYDCSDIGDASVTLFVTDADGNQSSCMSTVTIADNEESCAADCVNPEAVCTNPQTINLSSDGVITVQASAFYAGDQVVDCAGVPLNFSFDAAGADTQTTFSCSNIGTQSVNLFVTDSRGARSVCVSSVTVVNPADTCTDCIEPVAMCNPNLVLNINNNGLTRLAASDIYSGARDTDCNGNALRFSFSENLTNTLQTFNCSSIGDVRISLYLTDNDNNQSTCNTIVSVTDTDAICDQLCVNPDAVCNPDVIANINSDGIVRLNAIDLYAGNRMMDCDGTMLQYSFSTNENDDVQTISCNEVGEQIFNLFVTTGDGSQTTCQTTVTITDDNNVCCDNDPSLVCRDASINLNFFDLDLNGVLDSSNVTVTVQDLIGAGTDLVECNGDSIVFSFSIDVDNVSTVFGCDDLGSMTLELFSTTAAGAVQSCQSNIAITDQGDQCQPNATSSISIMRGKIMTTQQTMIPEVEVDLRGADEVSMTDEAGSYAFSNMPLGGQYIIKPRKQDTPVKGLSTLDILLIRNHIYGHSLLDSPYKLLAADVNQSESITGADIVEIKKMLLGLQDDFSNNDSWRFISEDNTFFDAERPYWGLVKDQYPILEYSGFTNVDFTGIKIGDVNEDVNRILAAEIRSRSLIHLTMELTDASVNLGKRKIAVKSAKAIAEISGIQLALDHGSHMIKSLSSGRLVITEEDYAANVFPGKTTLIWVGEQPISVAAGDVLFYIHLNEEADIYSLTIDDQTLQSEMYTGEHLDAHGLSIDPQSTSFIGQDALFSHHPNPWSDQTIISFLIEEAADVKIEIFSMAGARVHMHQSRYPAGTHTAAVLRSDIPEAGIYIIQMQKQGKIERQKMLVIK